MNRLFPQRVKKINLTIFARHDKYLKIQILKWTVPIDLVLIYMYKTTSPWISSSLCRIEIQSLQSSMHRFFPCAAPWEPAQEDYADIYFTSVDRWKSPQHANSSQSSQTAGEQEFCFTKNCTLFVLSFLIIYIFFSILNFLLTLLCHFGMKEKLQCTCLSNNFLLPKLKC